MTKKQKNMLTRILVTAVLYAALGGSRSYENDPCCCLKAGSCCFVSHPLFCDRLGYSL